MLGLKCPGCGATAEKTDSFVQFAWVKSTEHDKSLDGLQRARQCKTCQAKFRTLETVVGTLR